MATSHELALMNDVEISPGFCPLCGDPWEACLCDPDNLGFSILCVGEIEPIEIIGESLSEVIINERR